MSDDFVLPFAPELIDFIKTNLKMTTYRFGTKYNYLTIANTISIQNSETGKIIGRAKITNKYMPTFKGLPLKAGGHEEYKDKEHQRRVFSGYYRYLGREIDDNDKFLVLSFNLL